MRKLKRSKSRLTYIKELIKGPNPEVSNSLTLLISTMMNDNRSVSSQKGHNSKISSFSSLLLNKCVAGINSKDLDSFLVSLIVMRNIS